jgi:hypothetical protein
MVDAVLQGHVSEIVIAHRDRLCRFAYDLLQWVCDRSETRLIVQQQDMMQHLFQYIVARHYKIRCYSSNKPVKHANLSNLGRQASTLALTLYMALYMTLHRPKPARQRVILTGNFLTGKPYWFCKPAVARGALHTIVPKLQLQLSTAPCHLPLPSQPR